MRVFSIIVLIIIIVFLILIYIKVNYIINPFIVYYGSFEEKKSNELMNYPVVILEARNYDKNQIDNIKSKGSKVFAYISFVEQNENNSEFSNLKDEWFYKPNNKKLRVNKWEAYYMDLSKKGYISFLRDQIIEQVINKDCDGLFIDTIGDIDEVNWNEADKILMKQSYNKFLIEIKEEFNIEIIQNRGFDIFTEYSYKSVDGIMWENFSFSMLKSSKWAKNKFNEIKKYNKDLYIISNDSTVKNSKYKYKGKVYIFTYGTDIYD